MISMIATILVCPALPCTVLLALAWPCLGQNGGGGTILYYTILYYTILYYTIPYYTILLY